MYEEQEEREEIVFQNYLYDHSTHLLEMKATNGVTFVWCTECGRRLGKLSQLDHIQPTIICTHPIIMLLYYIPVSNVISGATFVQCKKCETCFGELRQIHTGTDLPGFPPMEEVK